MKNNSVYDCVMLPLNKIHNRAGNITIVESNKNVPFKVKRIYYLYDIPGGEDRGAGWEEGPRRGGGVDRRGDHSPAQRWTPRDVLREVEAAERRGGKGKGKGKGERERGKGKGERAF